MVGAQPRHHDDEDYTNESGNAEHSMDGAEVWCATALAGMAFQSRAEGTVWRVTRRVQTPEDLPAWLPASRVAARGATGRRQLTKGGR